MCKPRIAAVLNFISVLVLSFAVLIGCDYTGQKSSAALIGNVTLGSRYNVSGANDVNAFRYRADSTITVSSMGVCLVNGTTGKMKLAIYSDSDNKPSKLICSTNEIWRPAAGWNEFSLSAPQELVKGKYYWLCEWSDSSYTTRCESTAEADEKVRKNNIEMYGIEEYGSNWPEGSRISKGTYSFSDNIYARAAEEEKPEPVPTPAPPTPTPMPDTRGNLAFGKSVEISSRSDPNSVCDPSNVNDGDMGTRWSSEYTEDEWLYVDLGKSTKISSVRIAWERACAKEYKIQVSDNATDWKDVYYTDNSPGGTEDISFMPVSGRYVRMLGIKRATVWGYSFWEIEVYEGAPPAPTPTPTLAPMPTPGSERGRPYIHKNTLVTDKGSLLRGSTLWMMNGENHDAYRKWPLTDACWDMFAKYNLNAVRISCDYNTVRENQPEPVFNLDQYVAWLDDFIARAVKKNLYVMIDYHGTDGNLKGVMPNAEEFWKKVAPRYKDLKNVIYEIANEPVQWKPADYKPDDLKCQETLYNIVRSAAPDTPIVMLSFAVSRNDGSNPAPHMKDVADKLNGIDWSKALVAFHGYWVTTSEDMKELKESYPVLNTEFMGPSGTFTSMGVWPIENSRWQVEVMERLGISWFGWNINENGPDFLPDLHKNAVGLGYYWPEDPK